MDNQPEIHHLWRTTSQFVKFCVVGVLNTAVDLLFYFLLTRYLGLGGELIYIAKGSSFIIATLNSFVLNRLWTFKQAGSFQWAEMLKFYLAVGSGIFINVGVHYINVQFLGINDLASSLITALFTAAWGFTLVRYFVFK
jgi:putative flippase GtrA